MRRYPLLKPLNPRDFIPAFLIIIMMLHLTDAFSQVQLEIRATGISEGRASLTALSGRNKFRKVAGPVMFSGNEAIVLNVDAVNLPGDFVLTVEYPGKDNKYTKTEKILILCNGNTELTIDPSFPDDTLKTRFNPDELENRTFNKFLEEQKMRATNCQSLLQLLMNYEEGNFYRLAAEEFEKERRMLNNWIHDKAKADSALFCSHLYKFSCITPFGYNDGTIKPKNRIEWITSHYFDEIDFNDTMITRSTQFNEWMNNFVNLHTQMVESKQELDSMLMLAARSAMEKAKNGSPHVYGWMADYFYQGFESNNVPTGLRVLEPYLADPLCLTTKRMEINRRLAGMCKLQPGTPAPDFSLKDINGSTFNLKSFNPSTPYILLLFWSADCPHCEDLTQKLYPSLNKDKITVVAISLDETETELAAWHRKAALLKGWIHLNAPDGIRNRVAEDYYILSTPVTLLIDTKTKKIVSMEDDNIL